MSDSQHTLAITSMMMQKWVAAIKSGNQEQVVSLYHVDGILLGTFSNKERVGYDLILAYFENLLKSPVDVEIISEHPGYLGPDAVMNSGHYNFITGGKTINARFTFVYRRKYDEWKIASHHSSILPEN